MLLFMVVQAQPDGPGGISDVANILIVDDDPAVPITIRSLQKPFRVEILCATIDGCPKQARSSCLPQSDVSSARG
jgi:hypothetical protein